MNTTIIHIYNLQGNFQFTFYILIGQVLWNLHLNQEKFIE